MTDEDKQWLERHGFTLDNELSRKIGNPVYTKHPSPLEETRISLYIKYEVMFWKFSVCFPYKHECIVFEQLFPKLSDEALEYFIERWNRVECINMLEKMNKEYFIPEAMKN